MTLNTAMKNLPLIQVGQLSVTGENMVNHLGSLHRNSMDWLTDWLNMTLIVLTEL